MRELFPKWLIGVLVVPAIVVAVFYVVAAPAGADESIANPLIYAAMGACVLEGIAVIVAIVHLQQRRYAWAANIVMTVVGLIAGAAAIPALLVGLMMLAIALAE